MDGVDGAITNFMDDIRYAAEISNGFALEIGVGVGTGSTIAIQQGLAHHPAALHISIDEADRMVIKPVVPWWQLILGDSCDQFMAMTVTAFAIANGWSSPGLIFIDTEHTYEQMKLELEVWSPLAADHTVWLFHDTYIFGNYNPMTDAIKEFSAATGWIYDDFRTEAHGLGRMHR